MSHGNNPFEDESNPYASTATSSYQPQRPAGQPSGAVMGVAIVSYVMGGLSVLCGGCLAVAGGSLYGIIEMVAQENPQFRDEGMQNIAWIGGGVFIGLGILSLLLGAAHVLTGVGLTRLRSWARVLAIVIGIIDGIFGMLSFGSAILQMNPIACVVSIIMIGYCIYVLVIMFNPKYAAEFEG
ncbi:MAG: hypothetical protein COA78_37810 [Blastopirellula sp.]|nr:MAG: hypothetical protein COA78_37810 [Blastopirellula sp.]